MQIRNLGGSGLRVSAVGLGCNNFGQRTDLETSRKVIHKAIDLGVTLFDTADIYAGMGGSETVLGQVLGDRRKDIVLATKYSKPMATDGTRQGASRRYIMSAVEASLTRLKTDYIDLYQIHGNDVVTPVEETMRALDDLTRQGVFQEAGGRMIEVTNRDYQLRGVIDEVVQVSNDDSFAMARRAASEEGIPVGISSGAALAAVLCGCPPDRVLDRSRAAQDGRAAGGCEAVDRLRQGPAGRPAAGPELPWPLYLPDCYLQ